MSTQKKRIDSYVTRVNSFSRRLPGIHVKTDLDHNYLPVPKREVSMSKSFLGLKPLKRQMNVSLMFRVMSLTFMR